MPVKIDRLRPIFRIAGQKGPSSFKIRELLSHYPLLNEFVPVHENPVIVGQRPEATVELPVKGLGSDLNIEIRPIFPGKRTINLLMRSL
jgi:hypothetical protein